MILICTKIASEVLTANLSRPRQFIWSYGPLAIADLPGDLLPIDQIQHVGTFSSQANIRIYIRIYQEFVLANTGSGE
jgi:hypothetical protein